MEDFCKGKSDDCLDAPPLQALRCMFSGATAAEVIVYDKYASSREMRVIQRMRVFLILSPASHIFEKMLLYAFKRESSHESGRDDLIGVDVVAGQRKRPSINLANGHGIRTSFLRGTFSYVWF